ncbi:disease resistance (CC-NBS-LRR class) family protein, partial [Trifolium pratense]
TDEVLFSESVAQSLQQLEQVTIERCDELKHIIASSGSDHGGCNTSEEIVPAPMNSHFLMSKLRNIDILNCKSLESIFPICYVEGLAQLQNMSIEKAPKLEYVFGKCDHENHSSHHVMLPHLKTLNLISLYNLIGMCPENCQAKWPSQSPTTINIQGCSKLAIPWFNLNEIWSLQCLQSLTLADCEELKCLFSMETHTSLPELMYLSVSNCQELEQIVAANEELVELPKAELYFPKLKEIKVENCKKLKSLFPLSVAQSLQQLEQLKIHDCSDLKHIIAASGSETGGCNTSE